MVLPKELRDILGNEKKGYIEIFIADETIVLQKYQPSCVFCGNEENTIFTSKESKYSHLSCWKSVIQGKYFPPSLHLLENNTYSAIFMGS